MVESEVYTLMCRDVPVCDVEYDAAVGAIEGVVRSRNPEWCPPCALDDGLRIDRHYLGYWWQDRLVPHGRLPRYLQQRPVFARLFRDNMGLCLSDHYWMRPAGRTDLAWGEVNFFDNPFDETVGRDLLGTGSRSSLESGEKMDGPSFWSNGMLRKYWRIASDGTRQLCKASSRLRAREAVNETVVSEVLATLLPFGSFVSYRLENGKGGPWSVCRCFTDSLHEYVPLSGILYGDRLAYGPEAYRTVLEFGERNGVLGTTEALDRMMFVDCLFGNIDRHFGNFGFIRNTETLQYVAVAPLFDCGTSLWCDPGAAPFAPFAESLNWQADLIRDASWVDWKAVYAAPARVAAALKACGTDPCEAERVGDHVEAQIAVLEDALAR